MMLLTADYEALSHLDERGGTTAAHVAFLIHGKRDRSHSAIMGRTMRGLELRGFVTKLDDLKPVCWVRTTAGSEALRKRSAPSPATLAGER